MKVGQVKDSKKRSARRFVPHTAPRGGVEVSIRPQIAALVVSRRLRKRTGMIRAVRDYWDGERVTRAFLFAREAHNC
jgi:hypothetical protein